MDLKQIKELIAAMGRGGIKKLTIKEKTGYEIHLERHEEYPHLPPPPVIHNYPHVTPHLHHALSSKEEGVRLAAPVSASSQTPSQDVTNTPGNSGRFVVAPLVGTFYNAPSPDDPAFVKVGDRVEEQTVLCIIEAMKVMNEVKAGMSGVVEEILIENAHPVEFGTKMFRIV